MGIIVNLGRDRPRPRRSADAAARGAQILFFTGVRYCREDDEAAAAVPEAHVIGDRQGRIAETALEQAHLIA